MVVRYTRSVRFEESLRVLIALSESKPLYNSINVLIPWLLLVPQKSITPTWLLSMPDQYSGAALHSYLHICSCF
jgi:hypothetical protein